MPAFEYVKGWWARVAPEWPVYLVDTDHQPYNLAAVRNRGVQLAQAEDHDIVILADADAVLASPAAQLARALSAVTADGGLVQPFRHQRYLTAHETSDLIAGADVPAYSSTPGNGAMYVVRPEDYWRIGGSDERFRGWGGEDDGIVAAAVAFGVHRRLDGQLWSLHHADERRPVGTIEHRPNAQLATRYWQAARDRRAMIGIINEPGRLFTHPVGASS
jgi:hypothetical protein